MGWLDPNNRLNLTQDGLKQKRGLFWTKHIRWRDIEEAVGVKTDFVTYFDNLIIIRNRRQNLVLSEADTNFRAIEPYLLQNMPGFPTDWYDLIEAQPFNSPITLWKRA